MIVLQKFGLYTSAGDKTCHHGWSPGSFGYYEQDTKLFASWEVDYIKIDWCGSNKTNTSHAEFSKAVNATGRHMVLELCRGPYRDMDKWGYAPQVAQVWRAAGDHHGTAQLQLTLLGMANRNGTALPRSMRTRKQEE